MAQYDKSDIERLISLGFLKVDNKHVINSNSENHKKITDFFDIQDSLIPVITLKRDILKLNMAWNLLCELIQAITINMTETQCDSFVPTEEQSIKLELFIQNFFSITTKIRETLKNGILKTENKQITKVLNDEYSSFQSEYEHMLSKTIDLPEVSKFNDFFRNRIEHGGNMMIYFIKRSYMNVAKWTVVCDYGILNNSKERPLPKAAYKYYITDIIFYLTSLVNGLPLSDLKSLIPSINNQLQLRKNNSSIKIENLSVDEIRKLLSDKEFILSLYEFQKEMKQATLGWHQFNLSDCLGNIYKAHIELYEYLYKEIKKCAEQKINEFKLLEQELKSSNKVQLGNFSFDLVLNKNIFKYPF